MPRPRSGMRLAPRRGKRKKRVAEHSSQPSITGRLERELSNAGLQVTVEDSEGALVLTGLVDTAEARDAASDIVGRAAPDRIIDNQLDVLTVLPTDIDDFAGDEPSAEVVDRVSDIAADGGELEPDFTDQRILRDPTQAAGPSSSDAEDMVESGDQVYSPPSDPVVGTDVHGRAHVLGGFGTESDVPVERSAMDDRFGDEALADAVRRELREDAATADLSIVVAVRQGVAHLRGRVADMEDAENAEAVAARVQGVREVVEELDVASI
jgi:osmotically-inducible protein OsmY